MLMAKSSHRALARHPGRHPKLGANSDQILILPHHAKASGLVSEVNEVAAKDKLVCEPHPTSARARSGTQAGVKADGVHVQRGQVDQHDRAAVAESGHAYQPHLLPFAPCARHCSPSGLRHSVVNTRGAQLFLHVGPARLCRYWRSWQGTLFAPATPRAPRPTPAPHPTPAYTLEGFSNRFCPNMDNTVFIM